MLLCCENYLLSGYHVALELLMAFVPSVLAFACSFTTGSEGQRHFISQWSQVWNRYRRLKEPTPFWIKNSFGCYDLTCNIRLPFFSVHTRDVSQECVGVLTEVWVLHGLSCRQPLLVVVAQQLVQQVQSLRTHQVLILRLDELLPALPCLPGNKQPAF